MRITKHWGQTIAGIPEEEKKISEILVKEPSILEQSYNRIYFYAEINRENVLKLNRTLHTKSAELTAEAKNNGIELVTPIWLHINSYGGNIFAGLAALDEILKCNVDIYTIVDGCCASAATFLSIAGKRRYINSHGFMLIHQLWSVMWGKYEEFKDEMQNLDRLMKTIKGIYAEYTKVPTEKLEEILKHDLWFDAKQCQEYGLIDEILKGGR